MPRLIYSERGRVRVAHGVTGRPLDGQPARGFGSARDAESWYFEQHGPLAPLGLDDSEWRELSARRWRESRRQREKYLRARFPEYFPA